MIYYDKTYQFFYEEVEEHTGDMVNTYLTWHVDTFSIQQRKNLIVIQ